MQLPNNINEWTGRAEASEKGVRASIRTDVMSWRLSSWGLRCIYQRLDFYKTWTHAHHHLAVWSKVMQSSLTPSSFKIPPCVQARPCPASLWTPLGHEPGHRDGDVGGGATRRLEEARCLHQGHAGHFWNEVYQHLVEAAYKALAALWDAVFWRHSLSCCDFLRSWTEERLKNRNGVGLAGYL